MEHIDQQLDVGLINAQTAEVTELQRVTCVFDILIAVQENFTHIQTRRRQRIHRVRLKGDHAIHLVKDGAIDLRRGQAILFLDDLDVVRVGFLTRHELGRHDVLFIRRCPKTDTRPVTIFASRSHFQFKQRITRRANARSGIDLVTLDRIQRAEGLQSDGIRIEGLHVLDAIALDLTNHDRITSLVQLDGAVGIALVVVNQRG